jgi:hypothetical protein
MDGIASLPINVSYLFHEDAVARASKPSVVVDRR